MIDLISIRNTHYWVFFKKWGKKTVGIQFLRNLNIKNINKNSITFFRS